LLNTKSHEIHLGEAGFEKIYILYLDAWCMYHNFLENSTYMYAVSFNDMAFIKYWNLIRILGLLKNYPFCVLGRICRVHYLEFECSDSWNTDLGWENSIMPNMNKIQLFRC
jgi:hypothetical protein